MQKVEKRNSLKIYKIILKGNAKIGELRDFTD